MALVTISMTIHQGVLEAAINNNIYQFDQLTGIMTRNAFSKSYNYEAQCFHITQHATMAMTELLWMGWQTINGKGLVTSEIAETLNRTFCHRGQSL